MTKDKVGAEKYGLVDASPVKSFFVSMITRDILLTDSILDLLDNCVDGILRKAKGSRGDKPYKGFRADIEFDKSMFTIHDNCGGIPWSMRDYAFRMGPSPEKEKIVGAVGAYGIGLKRAIFKMGQQCLLTTKSGKDSYEVDITPQWIGEEENWKIPVRESTKPMKEDGTTIMVGHLHPGVSAQFGPDGAAFTVDLTNKIATQYAFIIDKGFEVSVNKAPVKPRPTKLVFSKEEKEKKAIKPYIFKASMDGVRVFLAVGFTRPIPSQEDVQDEMEEKKYASIDAGWTVLCNDRAVLYCDKSELTGWGEAGVPSYHTQFIAISGIVEFVSDEPLKLPTTTTKRGIDASSSLYLQVKNRMREGMLFFTDYTNKWKSDVKKSKEHVRSAGNPIGLRQIKDASASLKFNPVIKGTIKGEQFKPSLPLPPPKEQTRKRISYVRDAHEIGVVGEYLLGDRDAHPSVVGECCFERTLKEAKKR